MEVCTVAVVRISFDGVEYEVGGEKILEDINLSVDGPGLVQVLGPNGAGKTTLLRIAAGLLKPSRGRVEVCGVDATGSPRRAGKCLGYVPQRPPISRYNPMTVHDFLATRASLRRRWPRLFSRPARVELLRLLERVGLPGEVLSKRLWELSGGQLMRVFIARTLMGDPGILLLDEPLSPIDPRGKREFARLLGELAESKLVVVTSHDPLLLERYTKVVVLLNRRIYAVGPPSTVLVKDVLARVYSGAIIEVERHIHIVDEHGGVSL